MGDYILSIDQGTTSTRAVVFDQELNIISMAQEEFSATFSKAWLGLNMILMIYLTPHLAHAEKQSVKLI